MASFLDANIIVYAEDKRAEEKHQKARNLVLELWDSKEGVLSIQVLQEFFVTVTRKMPKPLKPRAAFHIVEQYLSWRIVENTSSLLLAGIKLADSAQLSFWDALVVQAALGSGCTELYTEDLNHGQRFGDLRIVNPFRS